MWHSVYRIGIFIAFFLIVHAWIFEYDDAYALCPMINGDTCIAEFKDDVANEYTVEELLGEYEIDVVETFTGSRVFTAKVKRRSDNANLRSSVEYAVFPDGQLLSIRCFVPRFEKDDRKGKGRALLKYLFNGQTFQDYFGIMMAARDPRTKRAYMKEAIERVPLYDEVIYLHDSEDSQSIFSKMQKDFAHLQEAKLDIESANLRFRIGPYRSFSSRLSFEESAHIFFSA